MHTAAGIYVKQLRDNHDLAKAARDISESLSPWGVLSRIYDCRGDSWPRFPTMPANCDFAVNVLTKELRSVASEAGFKGASHALWRRWSDDIVLAVVIPRYKNQRLLIDFMKATGASQWRAEHVGARFFRSLFPAPARARDVFLSRILKDSLPIIHHSARNHATT